MIRTIRRGHRPGTHLPFFPFRVGIRNLSMIPATTKRVNRSTATSINRAIAEATEESLAHHAGHPKRMAARLNELDREWDIERMLEANAAFFALTGTILAATVDRRWLALPALVTAFLFQHAIQGWCPPLPVLRRLGFRTEREIDAERTALKALRGDFARRPRTPRAALQVARA
jgi:hypothetical protein